MRYFILSVKSKGKKIMDVHYLTPSCIQRLVYLLCKYLCLTVVVLASDINHLDVRLSRLRLHLDKRIWRKGFKSIITNPLNLFGWKDFWTWACISKS